MTKFSNKLKKHVFVPFCTLFLNFGTKKIFSEKIQLCHTELYMNFQNHAKFQKKFMIQFQENTWMDGRMKDGQTLFYRTLRATLGVQKPTDMKTYRWTQNQRKNFKNQHCLLSMLVPQIECLYYPLNAEGVTQKGSLLPAHIR